MPKALERIKKAEAKIEMTPMIDVTFMLIIFFMVVSELSKKDVEQLLLPRAMQAVKDDTPPKDRVIINVLWRHDPMQQIVTHHVVIWQKAFDIETDEQRLVDYLTEKGRPYLVEDSQGKRTDLAVKIRADARCEYEWVRKTLGCCMNAGVWKISFGAQPELE